MINLGTIRQGQIHDDRRDRTRRRLEFRLDGAFGCNARCVERWLHAHTLGFARADVGNPVNSVAGFNSRHINLHDIARLDRECGRWKAEGGGLLRQKRLGQPAISNLLRTGTRQCELQ